MKDLEFYGYLAGMAVGYLCLVFGVLAYIEKHGPTEPKPVIVIVIFQR